jgi:tetratricopeptide (TPR) repeat protein
MGSRPLRYCAGALLCLFLPCLASARRQQQRQQTVPPIAPIQKPQNGSIYVVVNSVSGAALGVHPEITLVNGGLNSPSLGLAFEASQGEWVFHHLEVGQEYTVRVAAKGYKTEEQYVILPNMSGAMVRIHIDLHPTGPASGSAIVPSGHFLLSPDAQREVQQAMKDLKSNKISNAQKHLKKALRMAPAHPGVNYLMGLSYLRAHEVAQAIPYLEKSVSIDPMQVPAPLALGIVRYDQHDYAGAIQMLKKVIAQRPSSWQAHWVMASSYLHERNFEQARIHAEKALKAGKKQARGARLVLGEALAGLGRRKQAVHTLQAFLKENRHDPAAKQVRALIKQLRRPPPPAAPKAKAQVVAANHPATPAQSLVEKKPAASASSSRPVSSPADHRPLATPARTSAMVTRSTADLLPKENWAPPDVDSMRPAVAAGVSCPLPSILGKAGRQAEAWVKELQEFTATEHYQSVEINHDGNVGTPFRQNFRYLVFVKKIRPHIFALEELRQPKLDLRKMGAPFVGLGTPGLALVFHPDFQHSFSWSCEGLGKWNGEPAWVIHFEQSPDHPIARLMELQTPADYQLLPLKGLVWLSRKDDHVMHLETDLVKPIKAAFLQRDHFSIDYRLVKFRSHPVQLWLPERVDMYVLYRDHAYHNYSRFSHFELFWTGTPENVGKAVKTKPRN